MSNDDKPLRPTTPRTDTAQFDAMGEMVVDADFARQLERELALMTEQKRVLERAYADHEAALSAIGTSQWISVRDRLPEGKRGVPYMTYMTDPVLVLHRDRPDYPLTAHAALGDDLDSIGVRIPTNGASKYKWIAWHSICADESNPFDLASLRDSGGYEKKMPNYLGYGITHWMPIPNVPTDGSHA